MTGSSSSTGSSSMSKLISFTKKRPFSGKHKEKVGKASADKTSTSKVTGSAPDTMLEPFQEMVDEINWENLDDADIPIDDVNTEKPIASQAVAFVIRASRRGVVPLCAEVANLLKEKSDLEDVVHEQAENLSSLQEEVEILRKSIKGPPPVMKDFCFQTVQETDCQTMTVDDGSSQTEMVTIPCIREQNIEKLRGNHVEESADDYEDDGEVGCPGVVTKCGSDVMLMCSCAPLATTATQNPVMISIGVNTIRDDCMDSALGYFEHKSLEKSHSDLEKKHFNLVEVNSSTIKTNESLGSDLKSAKVEIVTLQKAIQEIQNKEYERTKEEEMMRQHETYSVDVQDTISSAEDELANAQITKTRLSRSGRSQLLPLLTADSPYSRPSTSRSRSSNFPGPIFGCKCHMCTAFFRSSGILGFACSPYVTDSAGKNPVLRDLKRLVWLQNSKLQIQNKDQIIAKNNRMGTVRYVGHLDGVGSPSVVYIGLELENQEGRHDGYLYGKRYFVCPHRHGLFIPLQDVVCVINKNVTPPTAHPPVGNRPPAITGIDSRGKISSVTLTEIQKRRRPKSSSNTSTTSSSSLSSITESSKSSSSKTLRKNNIRLPTVMIS